MRSDKRKRRKEQRRRWIQAFKQTYTLLVNVPDRFRLAVQAADKVSPRRPHRFSFEPRCELKFRGNHAEIYGSNNLPAPVFELDMASKVSHSAFDNLEAWFTPISGMYRDFLGAIGNYESTIFTY